MKLYVKGLSVDGKPRKDGRYQARYTLNGKQYSVYAMSKDEAQDKALRKLKGITEKTDNSSSMKLKYWLEKWLTIYKQPKLRPNSIKNYRYAINKHILPTLAEVRLQNLDTTQLQTVINDVPSERQREVVSNILFASLTKAYNVGLLQRNIVGAIEKYKSDYKPRRALEENEIQRLTKYVIGTKYELIVNLYLYAGLRRSEALALRWADIDMDKRLIFVRYQIDEKKQLQEPKTKSAKRYVPVLPELYKVIDKYYKPTTERIFDWTPTYTTHLLKEVFKAVQIEDIDIHSLRHTFATMLKDKGVPDDLRTKWLGHSKLEHKDRYEHVRSTYEQQYIQQLTLKFDTKKFD